MQYKEKVFNTPISILLNTIKKNKVTILLNSIHLNSVNILPHYYQKAQDSNTLIIKWYFINVLYYYFMLLFSNVEIYIQLQFIIQADV
jgi:hypothetical protein